MFMKVSLRPLRFSGRPSFSTVARLCREHEYERSSVHKVDYATKYAEKLQRRAEE